MGPLSSGFHTGFLGYSCTGNPGVHFGKAVDVRLDASFNRVAVEGDSEEDKGVEQEDKN
jgi:hypothetical protein